jgi:hypothetical protein
MHVKFSNPPKGMRTEVASAGDLFKQIVVRRGGAYSGEA